MNTHSRFIAVLVFACTLLVVPSTARDYPKAATSGWIPITNSDEKLNPAELAEGIPGKTYLTIRLYAGVMRSHDNWWTDFIKTNKNVGIVASITPLQGGEEQVAYSSMQRVMSDRDFEFSIRKPILQEQPLGRKDITVKLSLVSTAEDGVSEMMNDLKSTLPAAGVAIPGQVAAGLSIAKKLVDALFKNDLLKEGLSSDYGANAQLRSGLYAIFASKYSRDYAAYQADKLAWRGGALHFIDGTTDANVPNVSFIVVRVSHLKQLYPDAESVLRAEPKWADLYLQARQKILPINIGIPDEDSIQKYAVELKSMGSELTKLALQASALLAEDKSLTKDEREQISRKIMPDYLNVLLDIEYQKARLQLQTYKELAQVAQAMQSSSVGHSATKAGTTQQPILLSLPVRVIPKTVNLSEIIAHIEQQSQALTRAKEEVNIAQGNLF